ncbi:hypothetical protein I9W82_000627 [Candida metapsilosis]|uniref:Uncharacterized protein n=1 Tax=Candida metapsilosis TaxID=273372 RepID=A0A8H8DEJ6_9ASCO|nr:hypothetical protein I9W82_000627 [Candida metapsilosis]
MIRSNWSLAQEFKQNERKQQSKVQQRQKHQHKLEKLKNTDPIKLYYKIKNLELKESKSDRDEEYLKSLKEDWSFIEKNGLHKVKIKKFLDDIEKQEREKLRLKNKLWGGKSIYFNPELNPLGKVPNQSNIEEQIEGELENLTIPLRNRTHYEADPLIEQLGVKLPTGSPPKFYKLIQNTARPRKTKENDVDAITPRPSSANTYSEAPHLSSNSDADQLTSSDESEDEPSLKKVKYGVTSIN